MVVHRARSGRADVPVGPLRRRTRVFGVTTLMTGVGRPMVGHAKRPGGCAMAMIRASCSTCGDVEFTSRDVTVRVCRDDNAGTYTFACPTCGIAVTKDAEPRIVELLVASGVELVTWSLPAEIHETKQGDPIDHDDLLDFHALLETDGWMETLHRMTAP
jgi:hypothetical protein